MLPMVCLSRCVDPWLLQLKDRDEKLGEAGELQRFLGNLDHFQQWLSRTQTTVASEEAPNSLADAEKLLNQHQQLKVVYTHSFKADWEANYRNLY